MTPHLTLKIQNHTPHIIFHNADGVSKPITLIDEDLLTVALNAGHKLQLVEDIENERESKLEQLLQIADAADETYDTELPSIDIENLEFNLEQSIQDSLERMHNKRDQYEQIPGMSDEVHQELVRLQSSDILASVMDKVYSILIAKTLLAAYDLEINKIHIDDEHNYARFTEKMGNELQKLGLEFVIEGLEGEVVE